jgi:hypothetical protein
VARRILFFPNWILTRSLETDPVFCSNLKSTSIAFYLLSRVPRPLTSAFIPASSPRSTRYRDVKQFRSYAPMTQIGSRTASSELFILGSFLLYWPTQQA